MPKSTLKNSISIAARSTLSITVAVIQLARRHRSCLDVWKEIAPLMKISRSIPCLLALLLRVIWRWLLHLLLLRLLAVVDCLESLMGDVANGAVFDSCREKTHCVWIGTGA